MNTVSPTHPTKHEMMRSVLASRFSTGAATAAEAKAARAMVFKENFILLERQVGSRRKVVGKRGERCAI